MNIESILNLDVQQDYDLNHKLGLSKEEIEASFVNAKRIQNAIFRPEIDFETSLGESFVLYRPKNIVSGDFYWSYQICDELLIAVADCSGHGIGGAFLSILGYTGLKKVVMDRRNMDPADVLNDLNTYFQSILISDDINHIGTIDISIVSINLTNGTLKHSGARNPLIVIRDEEIIELKGVRYSIGDQYGHDEAEFTNQELQLVNGDSLYLFSDGFQDQLGGPNNKKIMNSNFRYLLKTISERTHDIQKQILSNFLEGWKNGNTQTDDVCVLGYKYLSNNP